MSSTSTTTAEAPSKCQKCAKESTSSTSTNLKQCSRCKTVAYCSKDCQSSDWPAHKPHCKRPNYIIKFHLCPTHIKNPAVVRTLSCPANATFESLHYALQIAFGWVDTHCYDFAVLDPEYECDDEDWNPIQIQMWMMEGKPASAPREFLMRVTERSSSRDLMSKVDRMHENWARAHPRTLEKPSHKTRLWQVLDDPEYVGKAMEYMYDFGDNWSHVMTVEDRCKATSKYSCLDGSGHGVAEDVKIPGWEDLKEAYRARHPTMEQKEQMHWYENMASNRNPRGLGGGREHVWPKDLINEKLNAFRP